MIDVRMMGPLAFRDFTLEAPCQQARGHTHNYDHVTFVQAGSVKVFYRLTPDGEEKESKIYKVGEFFLVKKDVYHRIKALQPDTRYTCVFAHRDADGLVAEEYQGFEKAYV